MTTEANIILMLEKGWVSRRDLREMLSEDSTSLVSDATARGYIRDLNEKLEQYGKCVLSTCRRDGYHIPNPESDEDIALTSYALEELKSKAISIFERRKVLERFLSAATAPREYGKEEQLTLF